MLSTPGEREILTEREFDAPRERVWAAYTDPALIPRWWGLRNSETVVRELDLRPGGAWRFVQVNNDGSEAAFRGIYREISSCLRSWRRRPSGLSGGRCATPRRPRQTSTNRSLTSA
jgi:Activator of Hsp90 ATPase homolog 1-like protein